MIGGLFLLEFPLHCSFKTDAIQKLTNSIYSPSYRCGVFHVSATGTNGSPEKLKRSDKEEMIFDFEGSFLPALEHCKQFGGVAPDPCVHLIFGQTCQLNQLNKNILISATITSQKAQECLQPPKASATRCGQKHLSV